MWRLKPTFTGTHRSCDAQIAFANTAPSTLWLPWDPLEVSCKPIHREITAWCRPDLHHVDMPRLFASKEHYVVDAIAKGRLISKTFECSNHQRLGWMVGERHCSAPQLLLAILLANLLSSRPRVSAKLEDGASCSIHFRVEPGMFFTRCAPGRPPIARRGLLATSMEDVLLGFSRGSSEVGRRINRSLTCRAEIAQGLHWSKHQGQRRRWCPPPVAFRPRALLIERCRPWRSLTERAVVSSTGAT